MGLLQTYDNRNKVTHQGLQIRYSVRMQQLTSGDRTMTYYLCTRYATKRYSYVGMDETTARECASAKLAQYTRDYISPIINGLYFQEKENKECMSDIAAVHNEAGMWSVEISVNETDEKVSTTPISNPAQLFSAQNARNYDESGASGPTIILDSVSRGDTTVATFSQNITGFNHRNLLMQIRTSQQGDIATYVCNGTGGQTTASFDGIPSGTLYISVAYGNYTSNTIESES